MHLVDTGLYIGTAAELNDLQALTAAGVTHILSVDSTDPAPLLAESTFKKKWINVLDEATSDLLSHLDECIRFIKEAVDAGGAALVHCQAGRSRSATIVTAYLMKTQQLDFTDAYQRLKTVKQDVQANPGFEEQLCLYEAMRCEVDLSCPLYKQYRLTKITEKYPELQQVPREVFAADPVHSSSSEVSYRCRKCRRTLFRSSSLLAHQVGKGASAFSHRKSSNLSGDVSCTSYFIEPVQWMEQALLGVMDGQDASGGDLCVLGAATYPTMHFVAKTVEERIRLLSSAASSSAALYSEPMLLCPKCSSKLGSFNWCGDQCSCGRWVTPAFQLHRNRVDEIRRLTLQKPDS